MWLCVRARICVHTLDHRVCASAGRWIRGSRRERSGTWDETFVKVYEESKTHCPSLFRIVAFCYIES